MIWPMGKGVVVVLLLGSGAIPFLFGSAAEGRSRMSSRTTAATLRRVMVKPVRRMVDLLRVKVSLFHVQIRQVGLVGFPLQQRAVLQRFDASGQVINLGFLFVEFGQVLLV